jgi:hypothetical protein
MKYVSNILVVSDPANPGNEGKVFLFQYGPKIFEFIQDKINPPEPEFKDMKPEDPVDVFDFLEGSNFRLRMRRENGYITYDKSSFDSPTELADNEDEMEAIWRSEHSLQEFVATDYYKSYEDLNKRFTQVVTGKSETSAPAADAAMAAVAAVDEAIAAVEKPKPSFMEKTKAEVEKPKKKEKATTEDDDDLSFFEKLAEE